MNRFKMICCAGAMALALSGAAYAQENKAAAAAESTAPVANPISSMVKMLMGRFSKNMTGAAEAMPADKFNFKPTAEMMTFAHLTVHIAEGNNALCGKISGMTPPGAAKVSDTEPKDKLVAALKASFDFCSTALANADDSKLSDPMTLFGGFPASRGGAMVILAGSWNDHYSQQAIYLRLNGILPPSAQKK
jgi:DinB family protein